MRATELERETEPERQNETLLAMAIPSIIQETLQPLYREIEANYTIQQTAGLAARLWYVPYISCVLYLLAVYLGTTWMSTRSPYSFRPFLVLWNLALTVLSMMGTYVMVPELYRYLTERGYVASVCTTAIHNQPMLSFWALIFVLSKIFEFGDTFFIIVRKTPLRFLHWYHHVTVCIISWYSLSISSTSAHWYCAMNFSVHSIMYSYYLLKALKVNIPAVVATAITLLQLLQFVLGFAVTLVSTQQYVSGKPCFTDTPLCILGITIYGSYFLLFCKFFFDKYLKKPTKKAKEQ